MGPLGSRNINVHTFLIKYIMWPLIFLHSFFRRRISGQKQIVMQLSKMVPKWVLLGPKMTTYSLLQKRYRVAPYLFAFYVLRKDFGTKTNFGYNCSKEYQNGPLRIPIYQRAHFFDKIYHMTILLHSFKKKSFRTKTNFPAGVHDGTKMVPFRYQ